MEKISPRRFPQEVKKKKLENKNIVENTPFVGNLKYCTYHRSTSKWLKMPSSITSNQHIRSQINNSHLRVSWNERKDKIEPNDSTYYNFGEKYLLITK